MFSNTDSEDDQRFPPLGGLESCEGSDRGPGRAKNTSVAKMEHVGCAPK